MFDGFGKLGGLEVRCLVSASACLEAGSSADSQGQTFEERTQARQEEIQSLKEALRIFPLFIEGLLWRATPPPFFSVLGKAASDE